MRLLRRVGVTGLDLGGRGRNRAQLADSLDPVVIRKEVETRFSPEIMVSNYVAAYEATIEATRGS